MNSPDYTIYADSLEEATRVRELLNAHPDAAEWQAGSSEPWIARLVAQLVIANDCRRVVEIGGFKGYTTRHIAEALCCLPHATSLTVCEIDDARARDVSTALNEFCGGEFSASVAVADSLAWIPTLADESVDFVWLDGNHEKLHVLRELHALTPKLTPGGIICGHDVFGVCDLREVFALAASQVQWPSMSLDLPRLGPAGGIGILQRPR
jgi:predicted O-methyltransferase YrrM